MAGTCRIFQPLQITRGTLPSVPSLLRPPDYTGTLPPAPSLYQPLEEFHGDLAPPVPSLFQPPDYIVTLPLSLPPPASRKVNGDTLPLSLPSSSIQITQGSCPCPLPPPASRLHGDPVPCPRLLQPPDYTEILSPAPASSSLQIRRRPCSLSLPSTPAEELPGGLAHCPLPPPASSLQGIPCLMSLPSSSLKKSYPVRCLFPPPASRLHGDLAPVRYFLQLPDYKGSLSLSSFSLRISQDPYRCPFRPSLPPASKIKGKCGVVKKRIHPNSFVS
jgi:hypothetical protein